jgi:dTMP kinase
VSSRRGRFVVLEGIDGSGTTTQAARLTTRLADAGIAAELTKEPSEGPLGAVVRDAIEKRVTLDETALALAFAADRADHLFNQDHGIAGRLEAGQWVVSDRYVLSTLAYQPSATIERSWLESINAFAIEPDLTIFLDADPATSLARIAARGDTDDLFHGPAELEQARANYEAALSGFTGEVLRVDAEGPIDAVAEQVWRGVREMLRL